MRHLFISLLILVSLNARAVETVDSKPYTFTQDEFCSVVIALHDLDLDEGIEVTKDIPDVDVCF